jgi:hypothetical protein
VFDSPPDPLHAIAKTAKKPNRDPVCPSISSSPKSAGSLKRDLPEVTQRCSGRLREPASIDPNPAARRMMDLGLIW